MSVDYHVEELADRAGVAVDTIRYYQREKLLAAPRREGRRAFYDDDHLDRIREIRGLAQQGFSLAQIRALSDGDGLDSSAISPNKMQLILISIRPNSPDEQGPRIHCRRRRERRSARSGR